MMTFGCTAFQRLVLIGAALVFSNFSSAVAQQCTLPSRIFLPTADAAQFEQFGSAVDIHQGYMVAGISENSSQQAYSGKAIVYKYQNNVWAKIAELTPSDPGKHRGFGGEVAIYGNTIVVSGREYNDLGVARNKLYVYEKSAVAEWVSAVESYVVAKPFGTIQLSQGFNKFKLMNNELVAFSHVGTVSKLEVYAKTAGVFSLVQSIPVPAGDGYGEEWNLALGHELIVISTEQYEQPDRSVGAAFVYPKIAGMYVTSPSALRSALQTSTRWEGFGTSIAVHNQTVFVSGIHESSGVYSRSFYVFEKPVGGWSDATNPIMFQIPGYAQYGVKMVANDNYLFSGVSDFANIVGFKKPVGGWSSVATPFFLGDAAHSEKSSLGYQLSLDGNHLMAGSPARYLRNDVGIERIIAYRSTLGTWEDSDVITQEITHSSDLNATNDLFGIAFSVYGDQLATTASQDDGLGVNSGVVYIFDAKGQRVEPDQKIYNPEIENNAGFGNCLAMGDSIMFIGAPYKDSLNTDGTWALHGIGKVYVYRLTNSGWKYASQIKAPNIIANMNFGRRVAWSKGYCAITEFYGGDSESVGRVHIFKEDINTKQFNYIATLDPAIHLRSDFFGNSMVMTDSLIVIGTGNIAPNASYRHSVYVFRKKGEWKNATEDARLYATDSGWSDRFGASVSMFGKYIVVGAPYSPGLGFPRPAVVPGAAYIFKQPSGGWKGELTQFAKLTPSDPIDMGTFGTTVAIDHNDIFIGSPNRYNQYNISNNFTNNDNSRIPGKVYHFQKAVGAEWVSTSQEHRQIESFEPEIIDGYGATMYVSDRYLYVGAMLDDTQSGFRSGSVQTMMQLPAIRDLETIICVESSPIQLQGFPKNGTWGGRGVHPVTGIFNPAVAGVGVHTITYERSGCETSVQLEVQAEEIIVTQQSLELQLKCIDASVPITFESNRPLTDYWWYFKEIAGENFTKFDSSKHTIIAEQPGAYQLIVNRNVCPDRVEVFYVEDEDPVDITIESVNPICNDNEVQLMATPTSGQWIGPSISGAGNINPVSLSDGMYKMYYQFTTELGCTWKDSVMVTIDKLLTPLIAYNGELICGDKPAELSVSPIDARSTIQWYGPEEKKLSDKNATIITVDEPGLYTVEVKKHSCTLRAQPVMVGAVADSLFVPNAFTANGDGLNDFFEVRHNGIEKFKLMLLNRYGDRVFETVDVNFKWSGQNVATGIYFWHISYQTCWNESKVIKGWVQVIN